MLKYIKNLIFPKKETPNHICEKGEEFTILGSGQPIPHTKDSIIYWHIENFTKDQDKYKTIVAFENCFEQWNKYLNPLRFVATGNKEEAVIVIKFRHNGDKDLPHSFGEHTLAYAFAPPTCTIYVNDVWDWANMHPTKGFDLFKCMTHEVGHTIGLGHTTADKCIMRATYDKDTPVIFSQDTLNGIEYLYGDIKRSFLPKESANTNALEIFKFLFSKNKIGLYRLHKTTAEKMLVLLGENKEEIKKLKFKNLVDLLWSYLRS